jgi:endo-1,3(4)-beta-glucanase
MPSNPYGSFRLQHESSSNFVAASGSAAELIASASSDDAAVFDSAYVPNAGTLQLLSTSMYVTADSSGDFTLSAARDTAGAWEKFTVRPKTGSGADIYSIKASSNGRYVAVGSDGSLRNNGVDESDSAGFRFVPI